MLRPSLSSFLTLSLALAALCGCGVKPGNLAPPGGGKDEFPHTYPSPDTDPDTSDGFKPDPYPRKGSN